VGDNFIIECKGRANESFPIRWKLFKAYVHKHLPNVTLYKPQNQKECEETVNLILGKRKTWSIESKGYLKYKELIEYERKYSAGNAEQNKSTN